jgi:hypothetical protein
MWKQLGDSVMCHDMRRFEKIAEEKKRKKEQELKFAVENQLETRVNSSSKVKD